MERKTTEKERNRKGKKGGRIKAMKGETGKGRGNKWGKKEKGKEERRNWIRVKSEKCQPPLCLLVIIPGIK